VGIVHQVPEPAAVAREETGLGQGTLYQWASSSDYDPSPGLERIQATVLAINSADDERNPPETGIMAGDLKRIKNARLFLIPASEDTRGHLTAAFAQFWKVTSSSGLPPIRDIRRRLRHFGKGPQVDSHSDKCSDLSMLGECSLALPLRSLG
jgi:hypothetical protein